MATGELDELRALFASPSSSSAGSPPRETALPLTRIAKFGVADENRKLAEVGRMQKEERRQTREMEEAMRIEKARASKAKAVAIQERARLHKDMTQQMNHALVQQIRETEAEWKEEREMAYNDFREQGRKRVLMANALDARP